MHTTEQEKKMVNNHVVLKTNKHSNQHNKKKNLFNTNTPNQTKLFTKNYDYPCKTGYLNNEVLDTECD